MRRFLAAVHIMMGHVLAGIHITMHHILAGILIIMRHILAGLSGDEFIRLNWSNEECFRALLAQKVGYQTSIHKIRPVLEHWDTCYWWKHLSFGETLMSIGNTNPASNG